MDKPKTDPVLAGYVEEPDLEDGVKEAKTAALAELVSEADEETDGPSGGIRQNAARSDIYARRRAVRDASRDDSEDGHSGAAAVRRQVEMQSAGDDEDTIVKALEAEFGEDVDARDLLRELNGQDEAPAPAEEEDLDTDDELVEITVNGQKRFATSDEVSEAGSKANLQKILAADERFMQAKAERLAAEAKLEETNRYIQEQLGDRANHPPKGGDGADVDKTLAAEIEAAAQAVEDASMDADSGKMVKAIKDLTRLQAKALIQESRPAPQIPAAPEPKPLPEPQARANEFYRTNYSDLGKDPALHAVVKHRINEELANNPGADLVELTKSVADKVRMRYLGGPEKKSESQLVEVRRERKRVTTVPRAAGGAVSREPTVARVSVSKSIDDSRREGIAKLMASRNARR